MFNKTIGFLCPSTSWGGLEMNVFRLAKWMNRRGWKIILYLYPDSPLYEICLKNDMSVVPIKSSSKFKDLFLINRLIRALKKDKIKHLILHSNRNFLLVVLAKIFSGKYFKFIYQQHMQLGVAKKDIFHNWLYSSLDTWITPLPSLAKSVTEKTTIPPHKIKIIPQGIELKKFTDFLPDKISARKKLNLPEDSFVVGVIGRLDPKKGQHVLIEAANILNLSEQKIHYLIVGSASLNEDTGYEENLHQLTKQYNLTEFIHFHGHVEQPEIAFASLDIFTLTTFSETYGMVTIEAMASKLPVIATNRGGTVDIIEHGSNGILVEPDNPQALADAILQLKNNPDRADTLATNARKDALEKYSHETQCQILEDFIIVSAE
jgi:glycosyltransferase involved in cell wall biosynthesis